MPHTQYLIQNLIQKLQEAMGNEAVHAPRASEVNAQSYIYRGGDCEIFRNLAAVRDLF